MIEKSIGLIELSSVAAGFQAADTMLKAGNVRLLLSRSICSGKYMVLIGGDTAAVESAVAAGGEAANGCLGKLHAFDQSGSFALHYHGILVKKGFTFGPVCDDCIGFRSKLDVCGKATASGANYSRVLDLLDEVHRMLKDIKATTGNKESGKLE